MKLALAVGLSEEAARFASQLGVRPFPAILKPPESPRVEEKPTSQPATSRRALSP